MIHENDPVFLEEKGRNSWRAKGNNRLPGAQHRSGTNGKVNGVSLTHGSY